MPKEHSSRYYSPPQYSLFGMIVDRHVEDCNNISDEEKTKLIKMFDDLGLPHIITESHIIITPDTVHDQSAVIFFITLLLNVLKQSMVLALLVMHITSDGSPTQFANKDIHFFISKCYTLFKVRIIVALFWST